MCGFVAYFGEYSKANIIQSTETIKHRGPDDTQHLFLDGFGCGFVRLSIIDVVGGQQPISNENNTLFLICNGEIYNYKQLRKNLASHIFKTQTDVEVILHLYEEMGERCIDCLEGMYAFLIYDSIKNKIVAGRDHIGIKPLFYRTENKKVCFSSELKVFDLSSSKRNEKTLLEKQVFGFVLDTSETVFEDVRQVRPGSMVCVSQDFSIHFYDANYNRKDDSIEDCILSAVETHLLSSDVDVGVALSGGLDSSLIAVLCKEMRADVRTFVISDHKDSADVYYASFLAKKYGFDHTEFILETKPNIRNLNYKLDYVLNDDWSGAFENIGDLAVFLFYREVSAHVKVILSGDGGDELFGGYWMHRKPLGFKDKLKLRSPSAEMNDLLDDIFPEDNEAEGRHNVLNILFESALPNYHLWTLDRASMCFGVESRVPYLDLGVVKKLLNMDISKRVDKKLLRNIYYKYLPEEIINRNKYGFCDAFINRNK